MDWEPRVGMRVVCIKDDWCSYAWGERSLPVRQPMLNEVLTITHLEWGMSGVVNQPRPFDVEGLFLVFAEIQLRQADGTFSADLRWNAAHFRPLDERKTDISIFTALLTKAPTPEKEPA